MEKSLKELMEESFKLEGDELSLSGLGLGSIPKELLKASYVKYLFLQNNKIKKIENLGGLGQLREIILHNNQIVKIDNIKSLVNLSRIYLSENYIENITKDVFPPNLSRIDLSKNKIEKLPQGVFPPNLEELDLRDNLLRSFPKSLLTLKLPIYWEKPMNGDKGIYLESNSYEQSAVDYILSLESQSQSQSNIIMPEGKTPTDIISTPLSKINQIYFSYTWDHEENRKTNNEQVVNEVYKSLKSNKFNVVRDKVDLTYGSSIFEFMKNMGKSSLIIIFISDEYLKSHYCMFELYEIARDCKWEQSTFSKRVLPIPIERIDLSKIEVFNSYLEHWGIEEKKLAMIKQNNIRNVPEFHFKKYQSVMKINQSLDTLLEWLSDMNITTLENLKKDNYILLKKTIHDRIKKLL